MNFTGLDLFQNEFGGFWVGVNFHRKIPYDSNGPSHTQLRFCEAVSKSKSTPIFITSEVMDCPGALLSLGWGDEHMEDKVIREMAKKRHITEQRAADLVKKAPRLTKSIKIVGFQTSSEPDVLINYALPGLVMKLLFALENLNGYSCKPEFSPIATVCGGVAVKAYLTGKMCLSFGCPDSREFGGFSSDRMVVGIPYSLAKKLNVNPEQQKRDNS